MRDVRDGTPIDLDKLRSINVGRRTRSIVREGRRDDGVRFKRTTDELGHTVTERAERGGDAQDVLLRPQTVTMKIGAQGA